MLHVLSVLVHFVASLVAVTLTWAAVPFKWIPFLSLESEDRSRRVDPTVHALLSQVAPFAVLYSNPAAQRRSFTLVLDLDETLIHASPATSTSVAAAGVHLISLPNNDRSVRHFSIATRPHLDFFLQQCAVHFELCVFTAAARPYADAVLDSIDPRGLISRRFYRDSCGKLATIADNPSGMSILTGSGSYTKDLSRVGDNLARTILLDDSPTAGLLQPNNLLSVSAWRGVANDEELLELLPLLIALRCTDDVRPALARQRTAAVSSSEFAFAAPPTLPRSRSDTDRQHVRAAAVRHAELNTARPAIKTQQIVVESPTETVAASPLRRSGSSSHLPAVQKHMPSPRTNSLNLNSSAISTPPSPAQRVLTSVMQQSPLLSQALNTVRTSVGLTPLAVGGGEPSADQPLPSSVVPSNTSATVVLGRTAKLPSAPGVHLPVHHAADWNTERQLQLVQRRSLATTTSLGNASK